MALFLFTAPAGEPLSLDEAKAHLSVDFDDDDDLIASLIVAAREHVETFTHRALLTQTWELKLDTFPGACGAIVLPMPPATSVTSIGYVDTAGATQTWSSALYTTEFPSGAWAAPARITPAYQQFYPVTRDVINAVTVRFVCGYGATSATVPASIRAAMKILIATWYGPGRESVSIGNLVSMIPHTVDALLWPFKAFV